MKKRFLALAAIFVIPFVFASCSGSDKYTTKKLDFYKNNEAPDRQVELKYYNDTPNIPYVGVNQFFNEFYKTTYDQTKNDGIYTYKKDAAYIKIDTKNDIFSILDIDTFSAHPDFIGSNSIIFLEEKETKKTTPIAKVIDLTSYNINAYDGNNDAYIPLSLISDIVTGPSLFGITYNEKALFEYDYQGQLSNGLCRTEDYYGELYKAPMKENTARQEDMINFSYNLICLMIDNFRGYTVQMEFIDNNVLSLGLNGTLEKYYPGIKELLLSKDRAEYIAGLAGLFMGLSDGGHTAFGSKLQLEIFPEGKNIASYYKDDAASVNLIKTASIHQLRKQTNKENVLKAKKQAFGLEDTSFYYHLEKGKKLAYIGFDSFVVDYSGWDTYYKTIKDGGTGVVPTEKDSYGFIRSKLYQALEDGVETVVLDLGSNGGGDSAALLGLVGLFNGGEAVSSFTSIPNRSRGDTYCKVDINLDGKYDEKDKEEAEKFKSMNIVLLTSMCGFSCGNLFPSLLKELGYKTIGEKTGGGSCAIMLGAMADGPYYIRSSYKCLANAQGYNIDSGVEVDLDLLGEPIVNNLFTASNYENFYNVEYVNTELKKLFQTK